ncbi:Putative flippase GtrA (transmembrane translocase of bactoprenol-linked glucose) [Sphingopyxis indica]|uniref:Putative flippase GtrA (Transmembrane translocase of bactoprenol-linked glucose) n=1 Tax=Sphingopyxis indica TaxID=436663 RepID=A0A239GCL3_9SPHN|nr:Putative flippase GtrA (transmembrane translocase of bactoprenol-linked glucose) [Sphingopyxis indica]
MPLPPLLRRVTDLTILRYVGASAVALGGDMALFLVFLMAGWRPAAASAASYCAGIAIHWLISSRIVFIDGARTAGLHRMRQKSLFVASALIGLAITVAIVAVGDRIDVDARLSKLAAIGISFVATYYLRKTLVFADAR